MLGGAWMLWANTYVSAGMSTPVWTVKEVSDQTVTEQYQNNKQSEIYQSVIRNLTNSYQQQCT